MSPARTGTQNGRATGFDLEKAAAAAVAEAESVPFAFTYKAKEYEVPPGNKWPVEAIDKLAQGDLGGGLRQLLGREAYERLIADGLTMGELNTLMDKVGESAGLGGLGNSSTPLPPGLTRT